MAGMPPPPDNFPAGWEAEWQPSFENAELAARPEPRPDSTPVTTPPIAERQKTALVPPTTSRPPEASRDPGLTPTPQNRPAALPRVPALPSLYAPLARADQDNDNPPKQITLILRSMGDRDRDKLRIKTLYGTLISFHGRDRFSFQIFEGGKGHLIDFPNDTTRIGPELLARLLKLLSEESWRIEEITFQ
jgi:hypothetical protein